MKKIKTISIIELLADYSSEYKAIKWLEKIRIDEFVFRLNEGNCQIDIKDRMVSLLKGIGNNRISYKVLTS